MLSARLSPSSNMTAEPATPGSKFVCSTTDFAFVLRFGLSPAGIFATTGAGRVAGAVAKAGVGAAGAAGAGAADTAGAGFDTTGSGILKASGATFTSVFSSDFLSGAVLALTS